MFNIDEVSNPTVVHGATIFPERGSDKQKNDISIEIEKISRDQGWVVPKLARAFV